MTAKKFYMRNTSTIVTVLIVAMALATTSLGSRYSFLDTTLCELSTNPNRHPQELVRVRAFILGDKLHGIALVDPSCADTGAAFDFNEGTSPIIEVIKDKDYSRLEALYDRILELNRANQHIYGTFEGVFKWFRNQKPTRVFFLHRVTNIYVGERDDPTYALQQ